MFVKAINNQVVVYPYSVGDLRRDNPNVSFPKTIPAATLAEFGVYPVSMADDPTYDADTQIIEVSEKPALVNGAWELTKTAVKMTAEQLQARNNTVSTLARQERNRLLAETDWWAVSDRTMTVEQTSYRQALRDITAQAGFPNVTWPTKPE